MGARLSRTAAATSADEAEPEEEVWIDAFQVLNLEDAAEGEGAAEEAEARPNPAPEAGAAAVEEENDERAGEGVEVRPAADIRYYAVWHLNQSREFCGVHCGEHPRAWQFLLGELPNRRYTPATAALRRFPSAAEAEAGYLAKSRRHNCPRPDRATRHVHA